MKYLLLSVIFLLQSCQPEDQWGKSNLELKFDGVSQTILSGEGYFWRNPVYDSSDTVCYVIKNKKEPYGSWNTYEVYKISGNSTDIIFSHSKETQDIKAILDVSKDGNEVLLQKIIWKTSESEVLGSRTTNILYNSKTKTVSEVKKKKL